MKPRAFLLLVCKKWSIEASNALRGFNWIFDQWFMLQIPNYGGGGKIWHMFLEKHRQKFDFPVELGGLMVPQLNSKSSSEKT